MNAYQQMTKTYQNLELESRVNEASPHELVSMLYDGLLKNIKQASVCMAHSNIAQQELCINKAVRITQHLQDNLDFNQGKEVASHLNRFYQSVLKQLVTAHAKCDAKLLDVCHQNVKEIAEAWQQIKA